MTLVRHTLLVISLLLFVFWVALWLRSWAHVEVLAFRTPAGFLGGGAAEGGGILLVHTDVPFDGEYGPSDSPGQRSETGPSHLSVSASQFRLLHDQIFDAQSGAWSIAGFHGAAAKLPVVPQLVAKYQALLIPYWFLLLVLGLPIFAMIRREWRSRSRRRLGLCAVCGYDVRASASQCPECGTPITAHS